MGTHDDDGLVSRRTLLTGSTALLAGGGIGSAITALAAAPETPVSAPPLPWKWVRLDPLEAGRRGYRFYKDKGGCGSASYLSLLSLLKEKVGYPWTTMPDMLMVHAAAGFGGHGTLCGALAGASVIVNMVTYGENAMNTCRQCDRRSPVLVVRGAGFSDRAVRRPLAVAEADQGEGHVAAVPHLGVQVVAGSRRQGSA